MKKVYIKNNITNMKYGAIFDNDIDCDNWINSCIEKNSWGKEGEYNIEIIDENDDENFKISCVKKRRQKEYPSQMEILEALMENFAGRPEKLEYLIEKREAIRKKYPKPGQIFFE